MAAVSSLKRSRMLNSGTKKAPPPIPAAVATEPICTALTVVVQLCGWLKEGCQSQRTHSCNTIHLLVSKCSSPAPIELALRCFCRSRQTSACACLLWRPLQLCTRFPLCRQQDSFGKLTFSHVGNHLSSTQATCRYQAVLWPSIVRGRLMQGHRMAAGASCGRDILCKKSACRRRVVDQSKVASKR